MLDRSNTAWLLKLSIQIQALEKFVAALPGAAGVDVEPIKQELLQKYSEQYGDLVSAETQAHWIDVSADRLAALSQGASVPEFQK
jgi:hypothetical protein